MRKELGIYRDNNLKGYGAQLLQITQIENTLKFRYLEFEKNSKYLNNNIFFNILVRI